MKLNLYQQVDILFSILEELLNSPFNKQFDDKAKHVLSKYGLEVVEGKIVKNQHRVSAESDDEKIRKRLLTNFSALGKEEWGGLKVKDILFWLEKQGKPNEEPQVYEIEDGKIITYSESEGYKVIEPKFKIGDWVVVSSDADETVHQISKINHFKSGKPQYWVTEGKWFGDNYQARLWTIQDAKPGDIVCAEPTEGWISPFIAIYKRGGIDTFDSYCIVDFDGNFDEGLDGHDTDNIHPATKEQRDLLFQKMEESGYKWDAEKKELKLIITNGGDFGKSEKCEQKPILDVEIPFGAKDSELQEVTYLIPEGFHAEIEGDKVVIKKGKQKSAWSEEDEVRLQACIDTLQAKSIMGKVDTINTNWFKSLKNRIKGE